MQFDDIKELVNAVPDGNGVDSGDRGALYAELRRVAHRQLLRRRPGQTIHTTALVNEAYVKLAGRPEADWEDRDHFFSVAAVAMRNILLDYARSRAAKKRGGGDHAMTLGSANLAGPGQEFDLIALDEALTALTDIDERLGHMVELRFFGGLTVAETAGAMSTSERTVKRDWRKARAFLYQTLTAGAAD